MQYCTIWKKSENILKYPYSNSSANLKVAQTCISKQHLCVCENNKLYELLSKKWSSIVRCLRFHCSLLENVFILIHVLKFVIKTVYLAINPSYMFRVILGKWNYYTFFTIQPFLEKVIKNMNLSKLLSCLENQLCHGSNLTCQFLCALVSVNLMWNSLNLL